jgi:hypothetical protein
MTPAEVLRKAADLIEERGWWNGDAVDRSQSVCVDLALLHIGAERDVVKSFAVAVAGPSALARPSTSIQTWNDAQPNGGVVIAKLREVADDLARAS